MVVTAKCSRDKDYMGRAIHPPSSRQVFFLNISINFGGANAVLLFHYTVAEPAKNS
jgi:hypothetical protein